MAAHRQLQDEVAALADEAAQGLAALGSALGARHQGAELRQAHLVEPLLAALDGQVRGDPRGLQVPLGEEEVDAEEELIEAFDAGEVEDDEEDLDEAPSITRLAAVDPAQLAEPQAVRLREHALRDYRRSGVDRDDATRARIKELTEEMIRVGQAAVGDIDAPDAQQWAKLIPQLRVTDRLLLDDSDLLVEGLYRLQQAGDAQRRGRIFDVKRHILIRPSAHIRASRSQARSTFKGAPHR